MHSTPERVAKFLTDAFSGIGQDPDSVLDPLFQEATENPVVIKGIRIYSMCEHHLIPFYGTASVGYMPNNKIVGLSKIARALDILCKRPQVQERLTEELKQCLVNKLDPRALVVQIEAEHLCMTMRGVRQPDSKVTTMAQYTSPSSTQSDNDLLITLLN